MVLPTGINKATGLDYALRKLGLSFHEAVGVGNAENDHSFLERCEYAVAVADAVPSIRRLAALVAQDEAGLGVAELVDGQNLIFVGMLGDGTPLTIPPYRRPVGKHLHLLSI
jgi:hypothetical protein